MNKNSPRTQRIETTSFRVSPATNTRFYPEPSERGSDSVPDVTGKLFTSWQRRHCVYQGVPKALTRQHERGCEVEAKVCCVGVDEVVDSVYA